MIPIPTSIEHVAATLALFETWTAANIVVFIAIPKAPPNVALILYNPDASPTFSSGIVKIATVKLGVAHRPLPIAQITKPNVTAAIYHSEGNIVKLINTISIAGKTGPNSNIGFPPCFIEIFSPKRIIKIAIIT